MGRAGSPQPIVAVVELPEGTTVDSPGVVEEFEAALTTAAEALPVARVVSYASTGDRDFVSEDGRTTFGLIFLPRSWTECATHVVR